MKMKPSSEMKPKAMNKKPSSEMKPKTMKMKPSKMAKDRKNQKLTIGKPVKQKNTDNIKNRKNKLIGGSEVKKYISIFLDQMLKTISQQNQNIIYEFELLFKYYPSVYDEINKFLKETTTQSYIRSKILNAIFSPAYKGGRMGLNFFQRRNSPPSPQSLLPITGQTHQNNNLVSYKSLSNNSQNQFSYIQNLILEIIETVYPELSNKYNIDATYDSISKKYPFIIKLILNNKEQLCSDIYQNMIATNQSFKNIMPKTLRFYTESKNDLKALLDWMNKNPKSTRNILHVVMNQLQNPNTNLTIVQKIKTVFESIGVFDLPKIMYIINNLNTKYKHFFLSQQSALPRRV